MNKLSIAYIVSLQLYSKACAAGVYKKVTFEQFSTAGYEKVDTGQKGKYISEDLVVIRADLFTKHKLSPRAIKLLMSIIPELKMHNALWYYDHKGNSHDSAVIKELRDIDILFETEDHRIHYVNPDYLRKGSKPAVLALTTQSLTGVKKVTTDHIKPLGVKKTDISYYDLAVSNSLESLVGEEQAPYDEAIVIKDDEKDSNLAPFGEA